MQNGCSGIEANSLRSCSCRSMGESNASNSSNALQDLWTTRQPPRALHLTDPQLADIDQQQNGISHPTSHTTPQGSALAPVSACKALGLIDQHKDWSLLDNTKVASRSCDLFPQKRIIKGLFRSAYSARPRHNRQAHMLTSHTSKQRMLALISV